MILPNADPSQPQHPSGWQVYAGSFYEGLRPDDELGVAAWSEKYRVLPKETSSEPGPWRTSRVPYTREIMQVLSPGDPTTHVVFMAGTQVAKTETGNNWIGHNIDIAPGPMMMVLPTSSTGKRSSRLRLAKMIDECDRLRKKISDSTRDAANTTTIKEFPGGALVVAGSNSAADLKSMPVRYLFMDEIDEYPDDVDGQGPADALAEKRTDTFVRKKVFRTSTPTVKGESKIDKAYEASDQRKYFVPCPHCQVEQVLIWTQMRWSVRRARELHCTECGAVHALAADAAGSAVCGACQAKLELTERTDVTTETDEVTEAFYECAHCLERIDEHHKTWMFANGRWIAQKPGVGKAAGFHLPALYSPLGWYGWKEAVKKRLEADRDPTGRLLKTWTNTVLGETYAEGGDETDALELEKRVESYRQRHVPAGGLMLVASVDVQDDRLEVLVDAFGRGEESWTIAYERIYGDTEQADVWESLDDFLKVSFPHAGGNVLRIAAVAVDSGFRTQTVYDFCRKRAHRFVFAVKGHKTPGKAVLGKPSAQDIDYKGQRLEGGVMLWMIGTDTAKSTLYERLKIDPKVGGPGALHFPIGLPPDFFKQLTSERHVTEYHDGYPRKVWKKNAADRNEVLDLKVYAYAAAIRAGVTRMNWDLLDNYLNRGTRDMFAPPAAEPVQTSALTAAATDTPPASPTNVEQADNAGQEAANVGVSVPSVPAPQTNSPQPLPWRSGGRRVRSRGIR